MARRRLPLLLTILACVALWSGLPQTAQADDWKAMRAAGQLAEAYTGFLEARDPAAAPAAARVNAARRDLYEKRAAETGTTVSQVGRIYFKENLAQLPPGTWLQLPDGTQVQK